MRDEIRQIPFESGDRVAYRSGTVSGISSVSAEQRITAPYLLAVKMAILESWEGLHL